MAEGKDLTSIQHVILTGGALTKLPRTKELVADIIKRNSETKLLPNQQVNIYLDHDYILASAGIISRINEKAALKLMRRSLCIPE